MPAKGLDYDFGIYKDGKFTPYGKSETYDAKVDPESDNSDALKLISKGEGVHGLFKGENFRPSPPAGTDPKRGWGISLGGKYDVDHKGDIYARGTKDKKVGVMTPGGRLVEDKGLAKRAMNVLIAGGFALSLFFFSSNLTGNVVNNFGQSTFNLLGIGFFVLGLAGTFLYLKGK